MSVQAIQESPATTGELAKAEVPQEQTEIAAASTKFFQRVEKQFAVQLGQSIQFTALERTLAQHIFVKVNLALIALEKKRASNPAKRNDPPLTWANVDIAELAMKVVNRVALKLDALLPNHIHAIPYLNGRTKKYEVDLRIGYEGKDFIHRTHAIVPPIDVVYELVHETDSFSPHMKGQGNEVESYSFVVNQPFNRGKVIGGFGYIAYDDPRKNKLIIITQRDFDRSKNAAGTNDFWTKHDQEMMRKTIIHRVTAKIPLDPEKVNGVSVDELMTESIMDAAEFAIDADISENANQEVLSLAAPLAPVPTPAAASSSPASEPVPVAATPTVTADGVIVEDDPYQS